jgi:hypothetical protein
VVALEAVEVGSHEFGGDLVLDLGEDDLDLLRVFRLDLAVKLEAQPHPRGAVLEKLLGGKLLRVLLEAAVDLLDDAVGDAGDGGARGLDLARQFDEAVVAAQLLALQGLEELGVGEDALP